MILLVPDGLIVFLSHKVFVNRLTIILHTNTLDIGMYCAMSHEVAAESICFKIMIFVNC